MPSRTRNIFTTIKTEGSLLPADLLLQIVEGDPDIEGLTSESYHLARKERLNEVATRSWNRLQGAWETFSSSIEELPDSDAGTSLTRERWLLILFQELGYGRLTTRKAFEIGGQTYPISHIWQQAPIHLVSFRYELDKRIPGVRGAARVSPHSLVQEFLNRSDDHLWGFVSNGLRLRILRDNISFTRPAYVEFDLQVMMDGEAYSDFFLMYLLCHQSRVEVPEGKTPEHCLLEKWYNTAAQQGVRALETLREGVQKAIETLGGGFVSHTANSKLREELRSGELGTKEYYRQVLRQVYRLLFLFVTEDRQMLFSPDSSIKAQEIYTKHYSTQRLRTLAGKRRGTRHPDLFRVLRLIFEKLRTGCEELALPALGSGLFRADTTSVLNDADIANCDLLKAIRHLAFTIDENVLRPINYRNLGPEELGSVYESLLEMHPNINIEAKTFNLEIAAGSERKTTGSYYTPTSLVNCLLDSALEPVINEALKKKTIDEAEKALLKLKICDPACGSGHFLIAAAHRIAKRLAAIRAGEDEPAPESVTHALRDVIGHCIYGVDMNPMAVELCKVSLWIEALEPGKPLSFLDHHIKCGNSLLGTTPALIEKGIPDDAFKPIEGDDKALCREFKQQNKDERKGQAMLFYGTRPWDRLGNLPASMLNLDDIPDDTVNDIEQKQRKYAEIVNSTSYKFGHLLADTWCAAFVWKKTKDFDFPITEKIFREIEANPHNIALWMEEEINRLTKKYQFFHWHLEFPDVFRIPSENEAPENEQTGWSGGFNCILSNPPWEHVELKEKEFFEQRKPNIVNAATAAERKRLIQALKDDDPVVYDAYCREKRLHDGANQLLGRSGAYPLCGVGRINYYAVFAESGRQKLNATGLVGIVLPTGIATDDTTKYFFQDLIRRRALVSLFDFENRGGIFLGVHRSQKFCLLTMAGGLRPYVNDSVFAFFALNVEDLKDPDRRFTLSHRDIALLNPNTHTCPIFRSKRDAELAKTVYLSLPILLKRGSQEKGIWGIVIRRLFNMGLKEISALARTREQLLGSEIKDRGLREIHAEESAVFVPMYEGKMFDAYNHRTASVTFNEANLQRGAQSQPSSISQLKDPAFSPDPLYWFPKTELSRLEVIDNRRKWLLAYKDVTASTNERTVIATMLPYAASNFTIRVGLLNKTPPPLVACFLSNINSFVYDYLTRLSLGGIHLSDYIVYQVPVVPPSAYSDSKVVAGAVDAASINQHFFLRRVVELSYTAWDLEPFARDCGYDGPPFVWNEERRFGIRAELDAAYFHLYLGTEEDWKTGTEELMSYFPTPRDAVDYIMETFPIVKRKDEARYGSYYTKEVILEIYDKMAEAIKTAQPYKTIFDPPPGPPSDGLPEWQPGQPKPANWPVHIHPPKEHNQ